MLLRWRRPLQQQALISDAFVVDFQAHSMDECEPHDRRALQASGVELWRWGLAAGARPAGEPQVAAAAAAGLAAAAAGSSIGQQRARSAHLQANVTAPLAAIWLTNGRLGLSPFVGHVSRSLAPPLLPPRGKLAKLLEQSKPIGANSYTKFCERVSAALLALARPNSLRAPELRPTSSSSCRGCRLWRLKCGHFNSAEQI